MCCWTSVPEEKGVLFPTENNVVKLLRCAKVNSNRVRPYSRVNVISDKDVRTYITRQSTYNTD